MSASSSTDRPRPWGLRRRGLLALLLLAAPLAACGKKGGLRLPTPDEQAAAEREEAE